MSKKKKAKDLDPDVANLARQLGLSPDDLRLPRMVQERRNAPAYSDKPLWPLSPYPDILWTIKQLSATVPADAKGTQITSAIIALGEQRYCVAGHDPVKVNEREDVLFQSFLRKTPLSKPELADATGMQGEDAVTVLRSLKGTNRRSPKYNGIFAPAIRLPGRRGAGSYHVSIQVEEARN
jgi:hypothetical protein